jgi:hypothetical protein
MNSQYEPYIPDASLAGGSALGYLPRPLYPSYAYPQPYPQQPRHPVPGQHRPYVQTPPTASLYTSISSSFLTPHPEYTPVPLSGPNSVSTTSSALPSPGYSQSPMYPSTPHTQLQSFRNAGPQYLQAQGWQLPLTIPTSALHPQARGNCNNGSAVMDEPRDRHGSCNSVESTNDGQDRANAQRYNERVSSADTGCDSPAVPQDNKGRGAHSQCGSQCMDLALDQSSSGQSGGDVEMCDAVEDGMPAREIVYTDSSEIKQSEWVSFTSECTDVQVRRKCYNCTNISGPWRRSIMHFSRIVS